MGGGVGGWESDLQQILGHAVEPSVGPTVTEEYRVTC